MMPQQTNTRWGSRDGKAVLPVLILVAALGFLIYNSLFTVSEWEQAVVTQFGAIVDEPIIEAGLHRKIPFIQKVHRYDRRLLRWDGRETTTFTKDRKTIVIDVTARWRIADARQFLVSIGSAELASTRLNGIIEGAVKDEIAKYDLFEVVRSSNRILEQEGDLPVMLADSEELLDQEDLDLTSMGGEMPPLQMTGDGQYTAGRPVVLAGILREARARLEQIGLGIELEDVLIKQVNYGSAIEANVYAQMNAELQKISAGFRSIGRQRAERRLGEMERELASIQSEAVQASERIRGTAEAEAIRIYAEAYNEAPEFFAFLRRLQSYDAMLGPNSSLILSTDSPLYQLLKQTQTEYPADRILLETDAD
jgi:modulator of FtsH protease HflC